MQLPVSYLAHLVVSERGIVRRCTVQLSSASPVVWVREERSVSVLVWQFYWSLWLFSSSSVATAVSAVSSGF